MDVNYCRLCHTPDVKLLNSHIVPKYFFDYIKKHSLAGGMRCSDNPNQRVQDGRKLPFLCANCEELFSKYETYFSNKVFLKVCNDIANFSFNSNDDFIRYFVLSIAWRALQDTYETDKTMLKSFTEKENLRLKNRLEKWRKMLYYKNYNRMKEIEMHIIPKANLSIFREYPEFFQNNTGIDFKVQGEKDKFQYAFTYINIPQMILVCTVWGNAPSDMKQYKVGRVIHGELDKLPSVVEEMINMQHRNFQEAATKISDKQLKSILDKVKK